MRAVGCQQATIAFIAIFVSRQTTTSARKTQEEDYFVLNGATVKIHLIRETLDANFKLTIIAKICRITTA